METKKSVSGGVNGEGEASGMPWQSVLSLREELIKKPC